MTARTPISAIACGALYALREGVQTERSLHKSVGVLPESPAMSVPPDADSVATTNHPTPARRAQNLQVWLAVVGAIRPHSGSSAP